MRYSVRSPVLRALGFRTASCLGLIPSVLTIALSTGSILNLKGQFNANILFNVHDFLLSLIFLIAFGFAKCNFSSLACIFAETIIKTKDDNFIRQ